MNRRSFLAAVMGALAAPAVRAPALPLLPPTLPGVEPEWWRHYAVWDSAIANPGERLDELLLPPPIPDDFLISHLSIGCSGGDYRSLSAAFRQVEFKMADKGSTLIACPISILPAAGSRCVLPNLYRLKAGDDLSLRLASFGPMECSEPVTVTLCLQGMILRTS